MTSSFFDKLLFRLLDADEELYQILSLVLLEFNSKSSIRWLGILNRDNIVTLLTSCFPSYPNGLRHILLINIVLMSNKEAGFYI